MEPDKRTIAPSRGTEKETLLGFLEFARETVVMKCNGLDDEQMRSRPTVSSMTMLGMIKHLTIVERYWFQGVFLDADVDLPWSEDDPDADWYAKDSDTAASAIESYIAECRISDQIVREHDLTELAAWTAPEDEPKSLRWIMAHMINETSRHAGHADILREAIDGETGD